MSETMDPASPDMNSSFEDQDAEHVWSKGDMCLAPCIAERGQYYPAKIIHIYKSNRDMIVVVHFNGYGSDDNEETKVSSLKVPRKKKKIVVTKSDDEENDANSDISALSHIWGKEESKRLIEKFQGYEEDEEDSQSSTQERSKWGTTTKHLVNTPRRVDTPVSRGSGKRRKPQIVSGGQQRAPARRNQTRLSSNSSCHQTPNRTYVTSTGLSSDSDDEDKNMTDNIESHRGFDDEDMEKPRFHHSPSGPKETFVLSAEGVTPVVKIPATINQYLRDYQRLGIQFLYKHYASNGGAILGDDMGLGKTVQVIGFISAILGKTGTKEDVIKQKPNFIRKLSDSTKFMAEESQGPKKTFLIIGPASVLYNWMDELDTWGHFRVGKFHKNHKQETLADLRKNKLDVVVTTFETCRDNLDQLNEFDWDAVIADEAHKIKGMKAEITKSLKSLKCQRRFGLTGTALQNRIKELWCVLDWANPMCLGTAAEFEFRFEKRIERGQKHNATKRELAEARKAKNKFTELRAQWMIRRTKAIIADQLPKKEEMVVYCKPTSLQSSIYRAILCHDDLKLVITQHNPCDCGSRKKRGKCCYRETDDGKPIGSVTLTFMHLLLKAANHIALLVPDQTLSSEQKNKAKQICDVAFASHPEFLQQKREASFRTLSNPKYCGKMKVLQGLLSVFKKEKSKVLIFSLSTKLLDILEQYVMSVGYEFRRLDGKTPEIKRVALVREFNKDPSIFLFLASTKAGGVGLNMTGANVVVIFDPNWNPSHDLQAQDRAYRLGQGRDVRVYRLVCSGTIEENIYLRQVYKQQLDSIAVSDTNAKRLFHGIQGDKHNKGELFGIENMFRFRSGDKCLTEDIIKRNDQIEGGVRGYHVEKYVPSSHEVKREQETEEEDVLPSGEEDLGEENLEDVMSKIQRSKSKTKGKRTPQRSRGREGLHGLDFFYEMMDEDDKCSTEEELEDKNVIKNKLVSGQNPLQDANESDQDLDDPQPSTSRGHPVSTPKTVRNHSQKLGEAKDDMLRKRKTPVKTKTKRFGDNISDFSDEEIPRKKSKEANKKKAVNFQSLEQTNAASFDSVGDVFAQCGVVHTHENKKITGASKAEDHMSRQALQDVYELHQYSQMPAMNCELMSESSEESDDLGAACREASKQKVEETKPATPVHPVHRAELPHRARAEVIEGKKVLIGQTPTAIKMLQFEKLVKFLGCADEEALAEKIVYSLPQERQAILRDFYTSQDEALAPIFREEEEPEFKVKPKSQRAQQVVKGRKPSKPKQILRGSGIRKRVTGKGCHYSDSTEEDSENEADISKVTKPNHTKPQNRNKNDVQYSKKSIEVKRATSEQRFEEAFDEIFGLNDTDSTQPSIESDNTSSKIRKGLPAKNNKGGPGKSSHSTKGRYILGKTSTFEKQESTEDDLLSSKTSRAEQEHRLENISDHEYDGGSERTSRNTSQSDPAHSQQGRSSSLINDILGDVDVKKKAVPKRKAVPSRRKVEQSLDFLDFLDGDDKTADKRSYDETLDIGKSKHVKREEYSEGSDFDDFFDASQWVKPKKSTLATRGDGTSQKDIDTLIVEGNDFFDDLFKSGKMKKMKR